MNESVGQKTFIGFAVLLALFYIVLGALTLAFVDQSIGVRIWWGLSMMLAGVVVLAGLWAMRWSPLLGGVLMVCGAVMMGMSMAWTFVMPIVALPLVVFGVLRALRLARERKAIA